MINKYTAESNIEIAGKSYILSFNWKQRALFKSLYPDDSVIIKTLSNGAENPELLAQLVSCCLSHHHPEVSAEFIINNSPPIVPLCKALECVIVYSLWGPDGPPAESATEEKESKKKTR